MEVYNKRKSNIELLRIISMFMIVVWHSIVHGVLQESTELYVPLIKSLSVSGVNVFLLISSYFLVDSKFSTKKVWKLLLQTQFFSLILYLATSVSGLNVFSAKLFVVSLFPVIFFQYWFVSVYIVLYIFSPYFNRLLMNLTKKEHISFLLILFFINSIWSILINNYNFGVYNGYGITHFIFIYFLGAYLKKYGFIKINILLYLSIFGTGVLLLVIANYVLGLPHEFVFSYNSPIIIIMSVCLFSSMSNFNFSDRIINKIATAAFGVYLIHDYRPIRSFLWSESNFVNNIMKSEHVFISIFGYAVAVFVACLILSYLMNCIHSLLVNLIPDNLIKKALKMQQKL